MVSLMHQEYYFSDIFIYFTLLYSVIKFSEIIRKEYLNSFSMLV